MTGPEPAVLPITPPPKVERTPYRSDQARLLRQVDQHHASRSDASHVREATPDVVNHTCDATRWSAAEPAVQAVEADQPSGRDGRGLAQQGLGVVEAVHWARRRRG